MSAVGRLFGFLIRLVTAPFIALFKTVVWAVNQAISFISFILGSFPWGFIIFIVTAVFLVVMWLVPAPFSLAWVLYQEINRVLCNIIIIPINFIYQTAFKYVTWFWNDFIDASVIFIVMFWRGICSGHVPFQPEFNIKNCEGWIDLIEMINVMWMIQWEYLLFVADLFIAIYTFFNSVITDSIGLRRDLLESKWADAVGVSPERRSMFISEGKEFEHLVCSTPTCDPWDGTNRRPLTDLDGIPIRDSAGSIVYKEAGWGPPGFFLIKDQLSESEVRAVQIFAQIAVKLWFLYMRVVLPIFIQLSAFFADMLKIALLFLLEVIEFFLKVLAKVFSLLFYVFWETVNEIFSQPEGVIVFHPDRYNETHDYISDSDTDGIHFDDYNETISGDDVEDAISDFHQDYLHNATHWMLDDLTVGWQWFTNFLLLIVKLTYDLFYFLFNLPVDSFQILDNIICHITNFVFCIPYQLTVCGWLFAPPTSVTVTQPICLLWNGNHTGPGEVGVPVKTFGFEEGDNPYAIIDTYHWMRYRAMESEIAAESRTFFQKIWRVLLIPLTPIPFIVDFFTHKKNFPTAGPPFFNPLHKGLNSETSDHYGIPITYRFPQRAIYYKSGKLVEPWWSYPNLNETEDVHNTTWDSSTHENVRNAVFSNANPDLFMCTDNFYPATLQEYLDAKGFNVTLPAAVSGHDDFVTFGKYKYGLSNVRLQCLYNHKEAWHVICLKAVRYTFTRSAVLNIPEEDVPNDLVVAYAYLMGKYLELKRGSYIWHDIDVSYIAKYQSTTEFEYVKYNFYEDRFGYDGAIDHEGSIYLQTFFNFTLPFHLDMYTELLEFIEFLNDNYCDDECDTIDYEEEWYLVRDALEDFLNITLPDTLNFNGTNTTIPINLVDAVVYLINNQDELIPETGWHERPGHVGFYGLFYPPEIMKWISATEDTEEFESSFQAIIDIEGYDVDDIDSIIIYIGENLLGQVSPPCDSEPGVSAPNKCLGYIWEFWNDEFCKNQVPPSVNCYIIDDDDEIEIGVNLTTTLLGLLEILINETLINETVVEDIDADLVDAIAFMLNNYLGIFDGSEWAYLFGMGYSEECFCGWSEEHQTYYDCSPNPLQDEAGPMRACAQHMNLDSHGIFFPQVADFAFVLEKLHIGFIWTIFHWIKLDLAIENIYFLISNLVADIYFECAVAAESGCPCNACEVHPSQGLFYLLTQWVFSFGDDSLKGSTCNVNHPDESKRCCSVSPYSSKMHFFDRLWPWDLYDECETCPTHIGFNCTCNPFCPCDGNNCNTQTQCDWV